MSIKVPVSFKENDTEIKLLTEVKSHSNVSGFIKDAIKFYLRFNRFGKELEQLEEEEKYRKYIRR